MLDSRSPHRETVLQIGGMPDHALWQAVFRSLISAPGVHDVDLSLARGSARIRHDERTDAEELVARVRSVGCTAVLLHTDTGRCAGPAADAPLFTPGGDRVEPAHPTGDLPVEPRGAGCPGVVEPPAGVRSTFGWCVLHRGGMPPATLGDGHRLEEARAGWDAWLAHRSSSET